MATVFIADDDKRYYRMVSLTLRPIGVTTRYFPTGTILLEEIKQGNHPDLIILDIVMPGMDGIETARILKSNKDTAHIPIILLTGLNQIEDKIKGLDAGADDFICKPFHPLELRARVKSLLRMKSLRDELEKKNKLLEDERLHLERLVDERTRELEEITLGIVSAFETANAYNDLDTGMHIKRVIKYSVVLAEELGLEQSFINKIRRYAGLHDVGKVVVPDRILKKKAPLTPQEYEEMKRHTIYGYELLKLVNADKVAQNIARSHHERWDGKGYPDGLKGTEIPIEARIVSLADVYDALTTERVYKKPIDLETSFRLIIMDSKKKFDPEIVNVFVKAKDRFEQIWRQDSEPAELVAVNDE